MSGGTKTGLFLIELVVALLLFAFCAAICMQLFAAARERTRASDDLSQSVHIVTSAAECYKASVGSLADVHSLLGGEITDSTLVIGYDRDWKQTANGGGYHLSMSGNGGVAEIAVYETRRDGTEKCIYSITVRAVSSVA